MMSHEQVAEDLALYALGELPAEERAAMEEHLRECPGCRRDLQELSGILGVVGLTAAASAPPQRSRQRLLDAIAAEARPAQTRPRSRWLWLPALAAIILAALLAWKWNQAEDLRLALRDARQRLQQQQQETARAREIEDMLLSPNAVRVSLTPGGAKREPHARVAYQQDRGRVLLLAGDLAPLPANKVYELWLLPSSGAAPIPAGTFRPDAKGSAVLLITPVSGGTQAKAFAVTAEPEGGSKVPTMPILLVGAASS